MNDSPISSHRIATLIDREREGRFVIAFCPICDHAEEAEDSGEGQDQAQTASVAKIRLHIQNRHPLRPSRVKISVVRTR
jgi:hypothetical protein